MNTQITETTNTTKTTETTEPTDITETTDTTEPSGAHKGLVEPSGASRLARRQRIVVGGALLLALVSVGALVASTWVKSPAQLAADTAAPAPNLLTAPVQRTVLSSTVILRGVFAPGGTFQATPVSVAPTKGNPGGGPMIVTAVPATQGAAIAPGQVLVEYSGRPVYALPGQIPVYRDMLPGESGKDIAQLQAALTSLGYPSGPDARGFFGDGTKAAVTRFYAHIGYAVPTADSSAGATGADAGGPMVPMSELVFVPSFPAMAAALPSVGQAVSSPLITLVDGGLSLTGQLDPSQAGLVAAGMTVKVYSEATGIQATGTVTSVGAATTGQASSGGQPSGSSVSGAGHNDADGSSGATYIPLAITPTAPWNPSLDGQNVEITVTAATTATPVLAVPEAAISTGADGRTTVTVVDKDGNRHVIEVRAGVSADGLVQVSALGATLVPGEQVVVGQ